MNWKIESHEFCIRQATYDLENLEEAMKSPEYQTEVEKKERAKLKSTIARWKRELKNLKEEFEYRKQEIAKMEVQK